MTDMNASGWIDLHRQTSAFADDMARRWHHLQATILAGQTSTVMGKRVIPRLEWPDGLPDGFATEEEVREYGRSLLAQFGTPTDSRPGPEQGGTQTSTKPAGTGQNQAPGVA